MVRRNTDPETAAKGVAEPAPPGPGAVEHLDRLVAAVDGLVGRSGNQLSPLDLRLVSEEASVHHGIDERNRAWTDGVMAAIVAGSALDQAIPETTEASPPRRALHALLDSLRYEVDLDQLRDAWPRIRTDLRCYVLGLVREDAAEDLEALTRALQACGIRPLDQPEPTAAAAALRTLLRELLATRETDRARAELRTAFLKSHARGATPRLGRYLLARELSGRGAVVVDGSRLLASAEARALLDEPRPDRRPALPTPLVGPALICLAALDVIESRAVPDRPWRGRSAYNVLRVVSAETRWPADLRAMMESVLNGAVPSDDVLLSLATRASVRAHVPQGVSSPDPAGKAPTDPAPDGPVAAPSMGGDGTETSRPQFVAGPVEVSSPAPSDARATGGAGVGGASTGGDGTETSKAPFHAGLSEVSSPRDRVAATVRLFAFKESLETGMGAPREGGWVQGILLRREEPPKDLRVSRQQYTAMVALAKERIVVFPAGAAGRKARDRLRRRLSSWGVRVEGAQVKSQALGQHGERPTLLRLKSPFTVHLTDGIADRDGTARRLVREAERDAYLGQY